MPKKILVAWSGGKDSALALGHLLGCPDYQVVVVSVDLKRVAPDFCGRLYDSDFIETLPPDVDPCGERGEFHSFVFNAPYFSTPIDYAIQGFRELIFEDPAHPFACRVCDLKGTE